MTYILFFWFIGSQGTGMTTAEFNNRESCVKAAIHLRSQFGAYSGFLCEEKGKPAK